MRTIIIFFIIGALFSCGKNKCDKAPDVSNIEVSVEIKRLDRELFNLKSKNEVQKFINAYPLFSEKFLLKGQYPHDSVLVNSLYSLITNPAFDTLYHEVQKEYGNISELEEQFKTAFTYLKYYYPDFVVPEVTTIITGLGRDLFLSDSLWVIGLDFFLGENAKYKPEDVPLYMLKRYKKQFIVPSCLLMFQDKYNKTNLKDLTILADMVYYGKAYYFTKAMLPCTSDSIIFGYSPSELKGVEENEKIIWAHFVDKKLLYETNHFVKEKYVGERPKTLEIGDEAPGRIGRWLGWEIVKQYMEQQSDMTLQQLMKKENGKEIFINSKFKPER